MRPYFGVALSLFIILSLALGCGKEKEGASGGNESTPPTRVCNIALLGDTTRYDLLTHIGSALKSRVKTVDGSLTAEGRYGQVGLTFRTAPEDGLPAQARVAWEADMVLIVMNSTIGPLPGHREHVLLTRQMGAPTVGIVLSRSYLIEDPELLELEEFEMRELLSNYDLHGEKALCALDHANVRSSARSRLPKGPNEIIRAVAEVARKRPAGNPSVEGLRFRAELYALVPVEAFTRDIAIPIKTGPVTVLLGDGVHPAEIKVPTRILAGESGPVEMTFAKPIRLSVGQRFVLLNKGHITAAGFVAGQESSGE